MTMKFLLLTVFSCCLTQGAVIAGQVVELESVDGRKIKADILSHSVGTVTFLTEDRLEYEIYINQLTIPSVERVLHVTDSQGNALAAVLPPPEPEQMPVVMPEAAPEPSPVPATPESTSQEMVTIKPSLRLEGRTLSSGRSTNAYWSGTWGTFSRTGTTKRVIEITASTTAREPQLADVEIIFIWKHINGSGHTLASQGRVKGSAVLSKPFVAGAEDQASDTRTVYLSSGTLVKSGSRYAGWVARAIDAEGNVVAVTANMKTYEKLGYSEPVR